MSRSRTEADKILRCALEAVPYDEKLRQCRDLEDQRGSHRSSAPKGIEIARR